MSTEFVACPRCHHYRFGTWTCTCRHFLVVIPWQGKAGDADWCEQWELDAEAAVEAFCERDDAEGDYTILRNSGTPEVWCKDDAGDVTRWSVTAEAEPVYRAYTIKERAP